MKSPMGRRMTVACAAAALLVLSCLAFPADEAPKVPGKNFAPYPARDPGHVTDVAGLLTKEQKEDLDRRLAAAEEKTEVEIVIVTIGSIKDYPGTPTESIDRFARGLFDKYGIGHLPKNDGVLFLVAKTDRDARIVLGAGYGHDRDDDALRIMNETILPKFRKGAYAAGVIEGAKALVTTFAPGEPPKPPDAGADQKSVPIAE